LKEKTTMALKKDENYFDTFVKLVNYSCQAAYLLSDIMHNYNPDKLEERMKQMHDIEHAGDVERHIMMKKLAREFITPIEREDIVAMADAIDNVTDNIEDVLLRMYMFNIRSIREDALKMATIIVKCCEALKQALIEFHNFRKSQTLHGLIIEINRLEEEGDELFTKAVRNLYVSGKDPLEVYGWGRTLHFMELCCDACEDVSDVIESVMMKNS
jgi:predicted phosphate transport protein (TIGR00153 family)